MKKLLALLLSALLMLSLAACGGGNESNDDPLKREDGTSNPASQTGGDNTPGTSADIGDIDFGSILGGNGATDVVYGKQDEATKQAIIDEAKKDGVDVSFGSDGSMTVKDTDGTEIVQKPDGTWVVKDGEGGEGQIGGNWPDNEFTKLVPKPDFTLTAANTDSNGFTVAFSGATMEQMRDYAEKVKAKGFTIDPESEEQEVMGMVIFTYAASNADGYRIEIVSAAGTSGITITK